ncbi:MAG: tetratricopeptide repeat protein [Candidatus Scalindua sp.]|nr:tetratricopeptide repeat protein [Candidatus Scalindua sp.]
MKKFLFIQVLFVAFLLIPFVTSSYGAGSFKEHYNKGIDSYKQGKYDQAGKEFKKAIELKPKDVYALYGLGNTYYCKAKYDDAVKIYTQAININPDYAKVHYSLSLAYSKLGMTREAEKQKTIFRKLSQGGKSTGSSTHAKASHTSSHAKAGHSPKKSLSHAPKKSLHETKHADTHAASGHETKHAASGHEAKHAASGYETKHAASGHDSGGDSHSIFQGYSGETHKADERVFHKKKHGTYIKTKNPLSNIKLFVQDKWYTSGIHKVWISAAGFIIATQLWLCIVAFLCMIVWRIREKT